MSVVSQRTSEWDENVRLVFSSSKCVTPTIIHRLNEQTASPGSFISSKQAFCKFLSGSANTSPFFLTQSMKSLFPYEHPRHFNPQYCLPFHENFKVFFLKIAVTNYCFIPPIDMPYSFLLLN